MTRELLCIMAVMRFIELLAWICAALSSAMSAIESICCAMACLPSSTLAFWYAFCVSPRLSRSWICFFSSGSCLAAFWASRRACLAWKRAWNSTCMSRADWRFDIVSSGGTRRGRFGSFGGVPTKERLSRGAKSVGRL